jgi:hypothetical protein
MDSNLNEIQCVHLLVDANKNIICKVDVSCSINDVHAIRLSLRHYLALSGIMSK